jgi:tetratricopeptide (TPR) repeat protein
VYHSTSTLLLIVIAFGGLSGCASLFGSGNNEVRPLRITDVAEDGDAARRASVRLVDDGLVADADGDEARAQARYERALQVDASNPYAYLAIARHHVETLDPQRALQFLDRADALLRMQGDPPPGVQVHLIGLRGGALYDSGDITAGVELLDRARELSPSVWGDGALHPNELR